MSMLSVTLGLAMVFIGFTMVWKTISYLDFFGYVGWAEKNIGPGGSRTFYKLLGVAIIFIGAFVATGLIKDIILTIFSPLFKGLAT